MLDNSNMKYKTEKGCALYFCIDLIEFIRATFYINYARIVPQKKGGQNYIYQTCLKT